MGGKQGKLLNENKKLKESQEALQEKQMRGRRREKRKGKWRGGRGRGKCV